MKTNWKWTVALLATGALTVSTLAACGDDDEDEGSPEASAEEVTLVADDRDDYTFDLSATPTAETRSVVFDNQGEQPHVLIFARINEGFTTEEAIELEGEKGSAEVVAQTEARPGQQKTAEVRGPIEAGEYAMLCPIETKEGPHYELGQLEEFTIE